MYSPFLTIQRFALSILKRTMRSRNGGENVFASISSWFWESLSRFYIERVLYTRTVHWFSFRRCRFPSALMVSTRDEKGRDRFETIIHFLISDEKIARSLFNFLHRSLIIIFLSLFQNLPSATREIFVIFTFASYSTSLISKNKGRGGGKVKEIARFRRIVGRRGNVAV